MSVTKMSPSMMTASGKRTTPFGAVENPGLLLNLPDKVILRVDTLACLKEMWGENILMARQHLYELVAGTVSDSDFQELITSYYKRYAAFANYVEVPVWGATAASGIPDYRACAGLHQAV
mgnify:CR=1 FL=1